MATYNPAVLDNSAAIKAQGISDGIDTFTKLFLSGMQMRRQDAQQEKDNAFRDRQLSIQEQRYGMDQMMDLERLGLEKSKFAEQKNKFDLGVKDEADFTASGWDMLKQQYPDLIPPELDDKFASGSLGAKRQLLIQAQAMASRKEATTINAVPVGKGTAYMNNKGATLRVEDPPEQKPAPGLHSLGKGYGVQIGPDGEPLSPSYLVPIQGGLEGDLPQNPGAADPSLLTPFPGAPQIDTAKLWDKPAKESTRRPVLRFDEGAGRFLPFDPETGAPLDPGTGAATDPYAEFFK